MVSAYCRCALPGGFAFRDMFMLYQQMVDSFAADDLFICNQDVGFSPYVRAYAYQHRLGPFVKKRWQPCAFAILEADHLVGGLYFRKHRKHNIISLDYIVVDRSFARWQEVREAGMRFLAAMWSSQGWEEIYTMVCAGDRHAVQFVRRWGFAKLNVPFSRTKQGTDVSVYVLKQPGCLFSAH